MDSPAKKKTTTAFATPKKNAATPLAMDITRDNRVTYNLDSEVYVAPRGNAPPLKAWDAYHALGEGKEALFSPSRILLEDRSRRALLLSPAPAMRHHVAVFDVERGKNIAELEVKNMVKDIDMSIRTLTPAKKFAQLHDSPIVKEYGVGDNMVFTVQHDMRVRPEALVVKEKDKSEVKLKGLNYTAVVANRDGDVAVGTSNGEIKLYENPEGGWTKVPKNSFTQLAAEGHTVLGLDVSYDGEWLLWTTHDKIALLHLKFTDPKTGLPTTAFKTRCPEDKRNSAMVLTLHKDEMAKYGIAHLDFTPAKFDASTSIVETTHEDPESREAIKDRGNMVELNIVTSTGPYVISWNFRKLKLDYDKLNRNHEGRIETTERPRVTQLPSRVMATQFEYFDTPSADESVVVAATEEALSRLSLA